MVCSNLFSFSELFSVKKRGLYRWGKSSKLGLFKVCELSIPSERTRFGLSENQIIISFEAAELSYGCSKKILDVQCSAL